MGDRLNLICNLLRGLNLVWIIFCMLMVEFTINWNDVTGVVGEQGVGGPGQILPMIIGIFSFVRILWLMFEEWRAPDDDCCDEDDPVAEPVPVFEEIKPSEIPNPPPFARQTSETARVTAQVEDMFRRQPQVRYLVAWLPWLSQFEFWTHSRGRLIRYQKELSNSLPMTPGSAVNPHHAAHAPGGGTGAGANYRSVGGDDDIRLQHASKSF